MWQTPDPCEPLPVPRDTEDAAMRRRVVTIGDVADVTDAVAAVAQRKVLTSSMVALEIRRQLERRSKDP